MSQSMNVKDYVWVYEKLFTPELCNEILQTTEKLSWKTHVWQTVYGSMSIKDTKRRDYKESTKIHEEHELEVCGLDPQISAKMMPFLVKATSQYTYRFNPPINGTITQLANQFTSIRVNRYKEGAMMRKHIDHSYDKEHPILTMIGALNDEVEYEGGQFIVFDDYEVKLKKGDVVIFPSNFMYPHEVKLVTKGVRYSFAAWAS